MKVKELKELLSTFDENLEVYFADYNFGGPYDMLEASNIELYYDNLDKSYVLFRAPLQADINEES